MGERMHRVRDYLGKIDWQDEAVEELTEDFDYDTAVAVNEAYRGQTVPEGDDVETRKTVIKARLHRIYPERFLEERFENDAVNRLYSSIALTESGPEGTVSADMYGEIALDDYEVDDIVLDHSVVYALTNGEHKKRATGGMLNWESTLGLIDDVLSWNREGGGDVGIYFPGDLYDKVGRGTGSSDYPGNRQVAYELYPLLEEVGVPFDILSGEPEDVPEGLEHATEDLLIAEAAERLSDHPLIVTLDADFAAIEQYRGIRALPPDLAHMILRANRENREAEQEYRENGAATA